MKILFVQPIFAHNETTFHLNKKSLLSLIEYIENNNCKNIDFVFGGFCSKHFYWEELIKIIDIIDNKLGKNNVGRGDGFITRYMENVGKATIVNELSFTYLQLKNPKYIFTMDSDICFDLNEGDIFKKLICASKRMKNNALITLNQKENNRQMIGIGGKSIKYKYKGIEEEIVTEFGDGWCSGGAMFLPTEIWKSVGGYKIYKSAYAPDDTFLFIKVKSIGYSVCASKTISVIHPYDLDKEYVILKEETLKKINLYE